MNEEETLQAESEADFASTENELSDQESSSEQIEISTTVPYEDTIQYDLNYNFGYMSIWFGVIFGALLVLVFFKGFSDD